MIRLWLARSASPNTRRNYERQARQFMAQVGKPLGLMQIGDLLDNRPQIALALRKAQLVDAATLREWLVNVGRRSADERIAHLMCELLLRLRAVGRTAGDGYALPITQEDLADTTGLTSVHVNRMLGTLKQRGLIELSGRQLQIVDLAGLEALAEFKPNYLHIVGRDAA